jgi:purine-nucleoside phosphorylase
MKAAVAIIAGSGLGGIAEAVTRATVVPYRKIAGFPKAQVAGHAGRLVVGHLAGQPVAVFCGRVHLYEGHAAATVAFPVRQARELGARMLIVTNAAGGVNPRFRAGDLMLIEDHLNFMGANPLVGVPGAFVDLTEAYSRRLRRVALAVAQRQRLTLRRGVYAAMLGPSYETPAEVRALRRLGADAVGMSTVPEVIAARQAGLEVLGLSCITNRAAGLAGKPLSHAEVLATGKLAQAKLTRLLTGIVEAL